MPNPTPRPLTQDAGPTPLNAQSGREWEQTVGSRYREGMATIKDIRALVGSQYSGSKYVEHVICKYVDCYNNSAKKRLFYR
jgi:hypothetical protein